MHQKERVIAPILEPALGLDLQVPANFNTDQFGTFSREIERVGNQLETARRKAEALLDLTGASLAIASEGSFGPHPHLPYLASNRELVVLIDRQHQLEVVGQDFSGDTNYRHTLVRSVAEALAFGERVGFPEHGLVVMSNLNTPTAGPLIKGINSAAALAESLELALADSATGQVHLETDMRAHFNPTRMQAIARATQNLVEKLQHCCPNCGCPGFDVVETQAGLPCGWCQLPTPLVRSVIYGCQKCQYRQEQLFPNGIEVADPGQCAYCNP